MSTLSSLDGGLTAAHPATAFLSYRRADVEEVELLQQQLTIRGIRAWRDVTHMLPGDYTQEDVIRAIDRESDVFVLYVTPACLSSDFIWNIEVPVALRRHERDQTYHIIPIFRSVTTAELQRVCAEHGLPSLVDYNGLFLPDRSSAETIEQFDKKLQSVAARILDAALHLRLQRVQADRSYEPCVVLKTFDHEPAASSIDLDIDWRTLFVSKHELPLPHTWNEMLLPALHDVKKALSARTSSRKLHVYVQCILPAAFVLGCSFPESAHLTLLLEGRHGTWSTAGVPAPTPPFRVLRYPNDGNAHVAIVEIEVSRDTAKATIQNVAALGISYKHHLRFSLPDGPDHINGVKDDAHALAMIYQIGRELRRLCDREGVSHIHLFAAVPVALAVMIGHQLNALGTITFYHHIQASNTYVPACTFLS